MKLIFQKFNYFVFNRSKDTLQTHYKNRLIFKLKLMLVNIIIFRETFGKTLTRLVEIKLMKKTVKVR